MKQFALYLFLFIPLFLSAQDQQKAIYISRLEVPAKKSYIFKQRDSSITVIIDTLIMNDRSKLALLNKKSVKLRVQHGVIGEGCRIVGNDGKNNGTNVQLIAKFQQLKSLYIDVPGWEARTGNRHFANGDGGRVEVQYLASGVKPQTDEKGAPNFLSVNVLAGGGRVNAQNDVAVILGQIENNPSGVPLARLPQGRIYSGSAGSNGKVVLQALEKFPD